MDMQSKIMDPRALAGRLKDLRSAGKRVVFTNGCFDILNFGHCDLPFDMAQGGELVEPFDICVL